MKFQARQGDILAFSKNPPSKTKPFVGNVIAYGEVTGHSHRIMSPPMEQCDSVVDEKGDIYIRSQSSIVMGHDEHGSITFPANQWICLTRQREFDPLAAERERKVQD
jgi:hypothetical protein